MGMKINSDARLSRACRATLRLALVSGNGGALLPESLEERGMSDGRVDPVNFRRQGDGTFKSRKRRRGPVPVGGKPGPLQVLLLVNR